jgi:type VI secretion system secreted protein VgrG
VYKRQPKDLPTAKAHSASIQSLSGTASQGGGDASSASSSADQGGESTEGGSDANIPAIQGGAGTVAAWQRPDILLSAPGGVAAATPAHSVMSAGATASLVAGLDINLQSQRHTALAVKAGLSLFTYGKAQNPQKPNAETGMQLHAASGSVSVQAQASTVSLAAQQNIQLASTTNAITAGAPQHILLVGGGSGLKITSGNITLTTSGPANFGAGMKVLTGGGKASVHTQQFSKPGDLPFDDRLVVTNEAGAPVANRKYEITRQDGGVLRGVTNAQGQIEQQRSFKGERLQIKVLGKS